MKTIARVTVPGMFEILWEYHDGVHHISQAAYALDTEDTEKALEEFDRLTRESIAVAFQGA